MKDKKLKLILAALMIFALTLVLVGCTTATDNVEDPLSNYDVSAYLPFDTRDPSMTTPTPEPTVTGTINPPTQNWQDDGSPSGTPAIYVRLEEGDKNDDVTRLQNRLIELGYMSGAADGSFGGQTKDAVKKFQAQLGLSPTGIASPTLQERMFLSNAPAYDGTTPSTQVPSISYQPTQAPSGGSSSGGSSSGGSSSGGSSSGSSGSSTSETPRPYSTLRKGDSGQAVKNMQSRLIELGFLAKGNADGKYGTKTETAVKKFQSALGVDQTGYATGYLQEKMYAKNAPTAKPSAATPAPTPTYTLLQPGDSNDKVKTLQNRLKTLGFYTDSTVDGNYYASTTEAVKRFQAALGLNQDGIATVALQEKIFASSAPTAKPSSTSPTAAPTNGQYIYLSPGSKGTEVRNLQNRLIELGFLSGSADGSYGAQTTAAVKRFQAAINTDTTGIATGYLQEKIFASNAPTYKPSPTPTPRYVEMKPGDSGTTVKALQNRLKALGYFDGNVAGNYKDLTTAAVKRFQAAIGMNQDGIASIAMQEVLFSDSAPKYNASSNPTPTPTPRYVEMKPGDSGTTVKALQNRLKALGYFDGNVAGNYKDLTTAAVKRFQAAIGMKEDGIASISMQEVLFSENAPRYSQSSTDYTPLTSGNSGAAVRRLQARLIELGYMSGSADGDYGAKTTEAVKVFQTSIGVSATGSASVELQKMLFSNEAPYYASGSTKSPTAFVSLQFGDMSDEVRNLQKRLALMGFYANLTPDEVDEEGVYGYYTQLAVSSFQIAIGTDDRYVDGIASVELQMFLFSDEALDYTTIEPPQ